MGGARVRAPRLRARGRTELLEEPGPVRRARRRRARRDGRRGEGAECGGPAEVFYPVGLLEPAEVSGDVGDDGVGDLLGRVVRVPLAFGMWGGGGEAKDVRWIGGLTKPAGRKT